MASTDARPVPIKNTAYRVYFPILDADGDLVTGAASLDSEVSIDGGNFADCTNEATEVQSTGMYFLDLTSGEMNGDAIVVIVKTATSGAKTSPLVFYPQELGDIKVDLQSFGGSAGTFSGGRPEVNTSHLAGSAVDQSGGLINANMKQLSGDATAADNAESFFDGTGYAGTNNVIPTVTTLTNAPSDSSGVTTLLSRVPSGIFTGITSLAQWLGLIAGKQTGNSTARTELRATGAGSGTYDETTDSLEAVRDNQSAAPSANANADALLDRADAIETGLTVRGALRLNAAALAGKISGAETTSVTIRNAVADSKNRLVATVDADGNRSAITTDVS